MFRVSRVVAHFFISLFLFGQRLSAFFSGCFFKRGFVFFGKSGSSSVGRMNVHDFQGLLGDFMVISGVSRYKPELPVILHR